MKSDKKPLKKAAKSPVKITAKAPAPRATPTPQPTAPAKKKPVAKPSVTIPPILLEGDAPASPAASGPGQRYALGPTPPPAGHTEDLGELPEAYGTKALLLTARDPHWLYAHWDLTRAQLKEYNALSLDRHLVVRVHLNQISGQPFTEVHVHPESRNWFIHVGRAGAKFLAELGYYTRKKLWTTIATSGVTLTPPDSLSDDTSVRFATLPGDLTGEQLQALILTAAQDNVPLMEVVQQIRGLTPASQPKTAKAPRPARVAARWTPEQERALAEAISLDEVHRVWIGSLEITELVRRQLVKEISSQAAAQFSPPTSPTGAGSSLSSPFGGGAERAKGFWFNVNAELIIYGATEPDAEVTIGGRVIKLRPDGSFSYRFALPDGQYELPAVAVSADKTDGRAAELKFSRATEYRGGAGVHPQDPSLKPPLAANVA